MDYINQQSDDPLDAPNFDAVEYINQQFPSETSLENLDPFVARLQAQISSLDEEISGAVQAQSEAGEKAERDINEAQTAIYELHAKINGIKSKAEHSERMVLEICRDIQSLDHAKRNLQTTITALKRLHMLVTAVEQLKVRPVRAPIALWCSPRPVSSARLTAAAARLARRSSRVKQSSTARRPTCSTLCDSCSPTLSRTQRFQKSPSFRSRSWM
jgi:DNA repair exonuclease SbcCD ATPase subunit